MLVWRKRAQFRGDGSIGGYLRQIAYRTYLNARPRIERNRKQLGVDRSEGSPSANGSEDAAGTAHRLDQQALIDRVERVVDELPEGWREAFVLFRFEGLSPGSRGHARADAQGGRASAHARPEGRDSPRPFERHRLSDPDAEGRRMTARLDIDWVRAYAERRLSPSDREAFEARMRAEPELAEMVERYAEVVEWPAEPVAESTVTFDDLRLDAPVESIAPRRLRPSHVAIAAGILIAFVGGFLALRTPPTSAPSGPVVLSAIHEAPVGSDVGPAARPVPALAETYLPVVDRKLRFVEGLDDARGIARAASCVPRSCSSISTGRAMPSGGANDVRDERVLAVAPGFVFAKVSADVAGSRIVIPSELGLDNQDVAAVRRLRRERRADRRVRRDAERREVRRAIVGAVARRRTPAWNEVHEAARLARLGAEARVALEAAMDLASAGGVDAGIAELDQAIARFAGLPFEADFRRIRDRAAADRKFPALEYAR